MKAECTRQVVEPFRSRAMREELACYATWYNEHRPHQALEGRTPSEMLNNGIDTTRPGDADASNLVRLRVSYLAGRPHLPIVELQRAA